MRAVLVCVMLVGCGDGASSSGDRAPSCNIPAPECADGTVPERRVDGVTGDWRRMCPDGESWSETADGRVLYYSASSLGCAADVLWCWSDVGTIALRELHDECGDDPPTDCWAEDGESESCDTLIPRFRE